MTTAATVKFDAFRLRLIDRLESRGTYRRWVLVTALTGMFATSFPITILTVSLGDIADDFGTSDTMLTWVISGPFLASAVALPVFGKLGDLRGQRLVFLSGFIAATAVAGQSERFDLFASLKHLPFPGGRWLRTPALVLAMLWFRMRDLL